MDHAPGTICVASSDLARYSEFSHSMLQCWRPNDTKIAWQIGLNVAANFNQCIRKMEGDWVWIMGDDHVFPPDTLYRLLDRNVDVVVPLCSRRKPPFIPVLFKERPADSTSPVGSFPYWAWEELPTSGLHPVHVAGSAGMLIRKHVLDAIGDPWFEVGQCGRELMNEDAHFCLKLKEKGFQVYADVETWIGHLTPMAIWPHLTKGGQWTTGIDIGAPNLCLLPPGSANVIAKELGGEKALHDGQPKAACP